MTCLEKYKMDFPGVALCEDGCPNDCPHNHGYKSAYHINHCCNSSDDCRKCWDSEDLNDISEKGTVIDFDKLSPVEKAYRLMIGFCHEGKTTDLEEVIGYLGEALADDMPEKVQKLEVDLDELEHIPSYVDGFYDLSSGKTIPFEKCHVSLNNEPSIKDSGDRTQFESGAVRDMREGKGRCDLMPLEVVAEWLKDDVLGCIAQFKIHDSTTFLYGALNYFNQKHGWDAYDQHEANCTMLLEVSKHFEDGAKKYGENNWQKGIPVKCYIDSAVRHYLKWLRGDKDEPHDRAFVWNLMCCIWEVDYSEQWRQKNGNV